MTALDRQVRHEYENLSIGIILCNDKNRTIVEYALHDAKKPIGVATYEITRILPKSAKRSATIATRNLLFVAGPLNPIDINENPVIRRM